MNKRIRISTLQLTPEKVLRLLGRMKKKLAAGYRQCEALEELLQEHGDDLAEWIAGNPRMLGLAVEKTELTERDLQNKFDAMRRLAAKPGIAYFNAHFKKGGGATLRVNSEVIPLPPRLGEFIGVLMEGAEDPVDGFWGFISEDQILSKLQGCGKHALHQLVYRFRAKLEKHGLPGNYLEYEAKKGYRLRVQQ